MATADESAVGIIQSLMSEGEALPEWGVNTAWAAAGSQEEQAHSPVVLVGGHDREVTTPGTIVSLND